MRFQLFEFPAISLSTRTLNLSQVHESSAHVAQLLTLHI